MFLSRLWNHRFLTIGDNIGTKYGKYFLSCVEKKLLDPPSLDKRSYIAPPPVNGKSYTAPPQIHPPPV